MSYFEQMKFKVSFGFFVFISWKLKFETQNLLRISYTYHTNLLHNFGLSIFIPWNENLEQKTFRELRITQIYYINDEISLIHNKF